MRLTIAFQIFNERVIKAIYLRTIFIVNRSTNTVEYHSVASLFLWFKPLIELEKFHYFSIYSVCEDEDKRMGRGLL